MLFFVGGSIGIIGLSEKLLFMGEMDFRVIHQAIQQLSNVPFPWTFMTASYKSFNMPLVSGDRCLAIGCLFETLPLSRQQLTDSALQT